MTIDVRNVVNYKMMFRRDIRLAEAVIFNA
jgi:hypothetical protein